MDYLHSYDQCNIIIAFLFLTFMYLLERQRGRVRERERVVHPLVHAWDFHISWGWASCSQGWRALLVFYFAGMDPDTCISKRLEWFQRSSHSFPGISIWDMGISSTGWVHPTISLFREQLFFVQLSCWVGQWHCGRRHQGNSNMFVLLLTVYGGRRLSLSSGRSPDFRGSGHTSLRIGMGFFNNSKKMEMLLSSSYILPPKFFS